MINITSQGRIQDSLNLQKKKAQENQLAFEGRRQDHNMVKELTVDNGALFKPKERELIASIERLSEDSSADNIRFLMDVLKNNKYGVRSGSEVEKFLNNESSIKNRKNKQNVDWENILKNAIQKAISNNSSTEKTALSNEFNTLFPQDAKEVKTAPSVAWVSVNPNIKQEKELVTLRNEIINSSEFVNSKDTENKQKAKKMVDFFVASSEVAFPEKVECLKLLANLMKDEYEINPQLKDKKVQVLQEIANDIVIKIPNQAMLTIKDMSQRMHGMCAAISTSRKAMAHEHKLAYVSNLVAELNAKPTMEIYDVTDPSNKAKIEIDKADIDYKAAMDQKYRIVDAAVCNWMHIADMTGNGLTRSGKFQSFDVEHYGMFRDSHLLLDVDSEHQPKYDLLRSSVKTNSTLKSIINSAKEKAFFAQDLDKQEMEFSVMTSVATNKTATIIEKLVEKAGLSVDQDINSIARSIIEPKGFAREIKDLSAKLNSSNDKAEKAELKSQIKNLEALLIDNREGPKVKTKKIADIISKALPGLDRADVRKAAQEIYVQFNEAEDMQVYQSFMEKKAGLGETKLKSKYSANEKLFKLAAYNRVRKEFEVKVPERLEAMAKEFGVAADEQVVLKKLEDKGVILPRTTLDALQAEFKAVSDYQEKEIKAGQKGYKTEQELYKPIITDNKEIFNEINSSIKSIRRELIRDIKVLNKDLQEVLDAHYAKAGKGRAGQFWVSEGSSGLNTAQYSRLMKQLSGEDHFTESNVKKVLDHIQSGKGGSVSGTNVEHYEYSGHAQYVYDVKEEKLENPDTGKIETQRVMYHDNTWGTRELKHTWKDDAGHLRTDYGSNRGGKYGYLLDSTCTQGTTEREMLSDTGVNNLEYAGKEWAKKVGKEVGDQFPMFMDMILKGKSLSSDDKARTLVGKLFKVKSQENQQRVEVFFNRLLVGNTPKIDALASGINLKVNNAVFEALYKGDISSLQEEIANIVMEETESAPYTLFKNGGKPALAQALAVNIPKILVSILQTEQSDTVKKVQIAKVIEDVTRNVVYQVTNPGQKVSIPNTKSISDNIDKTLSQLTKLISGQVELNEGTNPNKVNTKGGIKTKEDFDAIPDNSLLKMLLNKMVMMKLALDDEIYIAIDKAKTPEDLKKAHELIVDRQKSNISTFFGKTKDAIESVNIVFNEEASKNINEGLKGTGLPVDNILTMIEAETKSIPVNSNGSLGQLHKQYELVFNKVVQEIHEATEGKYPEIEAKLRDALNNSLDQAFDKLVNVKSIQELETSHFGKSIVSWIDEKFDPQTDAQFLEVIKNLQNLTKEKFDKILNSSKAEDLGVKYEDPFYVVQQIRGLNSQAEKHFKNAVSHHVYNQFMAEKTEKEIESIIAKHKEWLKTDEAANLPPAKRKSILQKKINEYYSNKADLASIYKNFSSEFSYITIGKEIAGIKDKFLAMHGVRPSFPDVKPATKEQISEAVSKNLDSLQAMVMQFGQIKAAEAETKDPEELATLKQQAEQVAKTIKFTEQVFAKGLIRARHVDDTLRMLNDWVKAESKESGSAKAKEIRKELETQMNEDHLLNHPEELLEMIIKQVPEMTFSRDKMSVVDSQVVGLWKQCMMTCLQASKMAQVEFNVRELMQKSKIAQVGKALRSTDNAFLQNPKTGKAIPFESKEGINFLFQALSDPTNNNETLKYFIQQAGLTEAAINMYLDGPAPEKSVKLINIYVDQLNNHQAHQEIVQDTFEAFLGEAMVNINGKLNVEQLEELVNNYFVALDKAFADKGIKESKTLSSYKHTLEEKLQVVKQLNTEAPEGDALNFLLGWQDEVMVNQESYVEETIERAILHMNNLKKRQAGLEMLDDLVPDFSKLRTKINEYKIGLNDASEKIDAIRKELQEPILNRIIEVEKSEKAAQSEMNKEIQNMSQEQLEQLFAQQAESQMEMLQQAINSKDQMTQQSIIKQLVQDNSPMLINKMVEMLQNKELGEIRTYCAGILAQKGYYEPLKQYVDEVLKQTGGKINADLENDGAFELSVHGLIQGSSVKDPKYAASMIESLRPVFVASCDDKNVVPLMDRLLSAFLNTLPKAGNSVQAMLMDVMVDKSAHINAKCVACDVLGRTEGTSSFFSLFVDALLVPENFVDKASDKLFVMNVAMKSLFSLANRYPQLPFDQVVEQAIDLDLDAIATAAKAEGMQAESVDAQVKELQERVEKMIDFLTEGSKAQAA